MIRKLRIDGRPGRGGPARHVRLDQAIRGHASAISRSADPPAPQRRLTVEDACLGGRFIDYARTAPPAATRRTGD